MQGPGLPASIVALLDGNDLDAKIGSTVLLMTADPDGWPRMASLSVGELLVLSETELLLTLYRTSRTTRALEVSGKALLVTKDGDGIAKIEVRTDRLDVSSPGRTVFRAAVATVEHDEVSYAKVTHGFEFELVDGAKALERWRLQVDQLRKFGES